MSNYRLIALAILFIGIATPLSFQWLMEPGGSWLRPYLVWLGLIACAIWLQRHQRAGKPRGDNAPNSE